MNILRDQTNIKQNYYGRVEKSNYLAAPGIGISMAKSSEQNLDADLSGLRRSHLYIFDNQGLVGFPGHRRYRFPIAPNQSSIRNQIQDSQRHTHTDSQSELESGSEKKKKEVPLQVMT